MSKNANLIIIGGTISSGKSTLLEGLSKARKFRPFPELDEDNIVQKIILTKLYKKQRIHIATIQLYFLLYRFKQYEEASRNKVTSVLDRGIWEDWFFAKLLMAKNSPKIYEYFKIFWKNLIKEKIKLFGKPKAYIYLKVNWKTFKERIFVRGRKEEIDNFDNNKKYFKNLLNEYNKNFISLLKEWNIKIIVLNTNQLNKNEVLEKTLNELKKLGI